MLIHKENFRFSFILGLVFFLNTPKIVFMGGKTKEKK